MKKMVGFGAAALLFSLVGCVATPVPPVDRRVTLEPELYHKVHVTDVRCTKGTSDFLAFQANVVNNTDAQYPVQWKVQWLDSDGIEIESLTSSWDSLMLQPFEIHGLKGRAPRSNAADMRLHVRRGK